MSITIANKLEDIIEISLRSAVTKDTIRIIELSSLGDLIPKAVAESIRKDFLKNNVHVKQLTNLQKFEPWTKVDGYIERCMDVRFIAKKVFPIQTEMLIFDDTVAMYQVKPEVLVTIIENPTLAIQQKTLFDTLWQTATPLQLIPDGSTRKEK